MSPRIGRLPAGPVVAAVIAVIAIALAGALFAQRLGPDRTVRPFFGVDVPRADPARVSRLAEELGCGPEVVNRFVKLDSTFTPAQLETMTGAARTPMITLEPWSWQSEREQPELPAYSLESIVRGEHDADLIRIARVLAAHPDRVLLRFAHEMNADWYPWGVGANDNEAHHYVAAWKHVHRLMSREADNLEWVWAPARTWWEDPLALEAVYPGDRYVDYVAVSGYGHAGTAEDTYGEWYDEVRDLTDKPAILSEIGADGEDKTRWLASLADFVGERPDIVGFVYFNTTPESTGATGHYELTSDAELSAFRGTLRELNTTCLRPSGSHLERTALR